LVEDNPGDAELTVRAIRRQVAAAEVEVVGDGAGAAALDFAFTTGAYADRALGPTVVFLDVKLPRIDGLEVLRRLKGDPRTREVPVVVLSSSREERDLAESYRAGANSYVVKPVDPDEFERVVGLVAQYWLTLNQQPA
jgi:CheY-like chemotaxis protein